MKWNCYAYYRFFTTQKNDWRSSKLQIIQDIVAICFVIEAVNKVNANRLIKFQFVSLESKYF